MCLHITVYLTSLVPSTVTKTRRNSGLYLNSFILQLSDVTVALFICKAKAVPISPTAFPILRCLLPQLSHVTSIGGLSMRDYRLLSLRPPWQLGCLGVDHQQPKYYRLLTKENSYRTSRPSLISLHDFFSKVKLSTYRRVFIQNT